MSIVKEAALLRQVIWQQCWDQKACIHNPWGADWCLGIHACVRIVDESGTYFLELEVNGGVVHYQLANACFPVFTYGVASLQVCVDNLQVVNNQLKSLHLIVKGCVGGHVGPVDIGHCWDLFNSVITFFMVDDKIQKMYGTRYVFSITPSEDHPHEHQR